MAQAVPRQSRQLACSDPQGVDCCAILTPMRLKTNMLEFFVRERYALSHWRPASRGVKRMNEHEQLPPELLKGIAEFNQEEFFECHETLEELWRRQLEPDRQFTQGIIQIAVGYYHLLRSNRAGARKLFERGLARVSPFQPAYYLLKTDELVSTVTSTLDLLMSAPDNEQIEYTIPKIETANNPD